MIQQKRNKDIFKLIQYFELTTKPSSENMVEYIYSNKHSNAATQYQLKLTLSKSAIITKHLKRSNSCIMNIANFKQVSIHEHMSFELIT